MRGHQFEQWVERIILLSIYILLFYYFKPSLIFSETTVSGGDTGAHHYIAKYMGDFLLPHGRLSGWAPGWYAGIPMLYFYFPMSYLFIALLSYIIPYQIAFKLITILGVFLLPLALYWCMRWCGFSFPLPATVASLSLPLLFLESHSIFGGNIPSTLAGEFSFSIGFALSFFFIGLIHKGIRENRFWILNGVLLSFIVLFHILPVIVLVISMPFFVFSPPFISPLTKGGNERGSSLTKGGYRRVKNNIIYLVKVFTLGFCLSGFWSVPFLANLPYIAHMKWTQLEGIRELFPRPLGPAFIASAVAIFLIISSKEKRLYFFLWLAVAILCLYFLLPDGKLWNARFLPYLYTISIVFSAYSLTVILKSVQNLLKYLRPRNKFGVTYNAQNGRKSSGTESVLKISLPVLTFIGFILFHPLSYIPTWIKWNYSGYESKKNWQTLKSLMDYLNSLPHGRVMWEYRPELDKFGTPRVLELIPYFTKQPTMEGLLIESSITAPFHFIMQAETTKKPTHAVGGITYPPFSFDMGVKHMRLFNVKYFIAFTDDVRQEADRVLKPLKRIGEFSVYELEETGYVSVVNDVEYKEFNGRWRDSALEWFRSAESLERPIIFVKHDENVIARAKPVAISNEIPPPIFNRGRNDKEGAWNGNKDIVSNVNITNDSIEFDTDALGIPHIVKISYFPNWRAEGAEGPYLASPSLMAVIPEKKHVRLYFARVWSDGLGIVLTWSALGVVIVSLLMMGDRPFAHSRSDKVGTPRRIPNESEFKTAQGRSPIFLSIVIPAYNEEKNLKRTVEEILLYTKNHRWRAEVVIVDDGSNDGTWEVMEKIKKKHPSIIKILRNEKNEGKGSAVKKGMLNSSGEYVIFTDADLSYDLSSIELFVKGLSDRYDVVIGSRRISGSELKVSVGPLRRTMSRIFSSIVNLITRIDYSDTQCGFKGFTRDAAQKIFSLLTIKSFAFDVEALYIAKKQGLKIKEVPVRLIRESHISRKLLMHTVSMMCDILKIRFNDLFRKYRA